MTTLTSWQHRIRSQSTSAAAVLAALATIIGAWQLAVIFGNRVPSLADTIGRLGAEAAIGELWGNLAIRA